MYALVRGGRVSLSEGAIASVGGRLFTTSSRTLAPAVKSKKELDAKKAKDKRLERREAKKRLDSKKPAKSSPLFMDISNALRYLRAAEVGRPVKEASISIQTAIISERGTAPLQGAVRFPKPLKETRILCLSLDPEKKQEALDAGATAADDTSFIDAVSEGGAVDLNYDKIIATPDIEPMLRKIARVLGPRGLMPSAKKGTVTNEVGNLISGALGTQPFRERNSNVSLTVGRCDFMDEDVIKNVLATSKAVRDAISGIKSKKPILIGRTVLSSTHGPGIVINF
ncbi:DEKNAAC104352 [Brettanomyces naardenensis]|uniref:DEKNAAC104352 n=1 Tax=Brettanomyces naardenensis TaxID=13370 RepID=A0A448YQK5_BRENA|nr:DEKNAAC104352 [Brettanomyces naardenensis]